MNNALLLILFGLVVGVFSGVMGLGGGSIMIPVMVIAFGMTQQQAHGTSLAVMIPPVALPAVIEYARHGNVDWRVAAWTALGVLLGSFFGALVANSIPKESLKLVFGFLLIYVAGYTIFGKEHLARSVTLAAVLVVLAAALFGATRYFDRPTSGPPGDAPAQAGGQAPA